MYMGNLRAMVTMPQEWAALNPTSLNSSPGLYDIKEVNMEKLDNTAKLCIFLSYHLNILSSVLVEFIDLSIYSSI